MALAQLLTTTLLATALTSTSPLLAAKKHPKHRRVSSVKKTADIVLSFTKQWENTKTFKAKFHQTIASKALQTKEEQTGSVVLKKPGKLRWESDGDGSLQVLDGNLLTLVTTNKRRGTRTIQLIKNASQVIDSQAIRFLSLQAGLAEIFSISMKKNHKDFAELWLRPLKNPADALVAEIDKQRYVLGALTSDSPEAKVRVEFLTVETNGDIPDDVFQVKPGPSDVVQGN